MKKLLKNHQKLGQKWTEMRKKGEENRSIITKYCWKIGENRLKIVKKHGTLGKILTNMQKVYQISRKQSWKIYNKKLAKNMKTNVTNTQICVKN